MTRSTPSPMAHIPADATGRGRVLGTAGLVATGLALSMLTACTERSDAGSADQGPETWSVDAEPLTVIGDIEGDEAYLFQRIVDAELLPDGRIVVADGGAREVRIFEPDGRFLREIGGPGEGPGELGGIQSIAITPPDTIEVYDWDLYRLTRFLEDGSVVSTLNFIGDTGYPELYLGRFSDGDHALAWIRAGRARVVEQMRSGVLELTTDSMYFGRFGPDGRLEDVLGRTTGMIRFGSPIPFSPFPHGFLVGDSIVYTDGLRPELTVIDGTGGLVRTIRVPIEAPDLGLAREGLRAEIRAGGESGVGFPARTIADLDALPETDVIPAIAELLIDDEGRFWVKRYAWATDNLWLGSAGGSGGDWLVVSPTGEAVADVRLPAGFVPLAVRGDRLLGVTRDDLGVERIAVHALER